MKKYIQPMMETAMVATTQIIADSGDGVRSNNGITYGGIDTTGKVEPAVKRRSVWDQTW